MKNKYLFTSERLGFRNWQSNDLTAFANLNADLEVMEHFPRPLTTQETSDYIDRLQKHFNKYGYNYFATEILESGDLIGFIGLAYQDYVTEFSPAVDIGWRLKKSAWGQGFASEGAKRCLEYGFTTLDLDSIIATCTKNNARSENVMKKLGMKKIADFNHPKLKRFPAYEQCICYRLNKEEWQLRASR